MLGIAFLALPRRDLESDMPQPDPTPVDSQREQHDVESPDESSPTTSIWYWLTFLISPLAAIAFFASREKDDEAAQELREREKKIRREHPDLKDVRDAAVNEMQCPGCKATINPITGDGFYCPPGEPWAMICSQCNNRVEPDT